MSFEQMVADRWMEMVDVFQDYRNRIGRIYLHVKDSMGPDDLEMAVVEAKDSRYFPDVVRAYAPKERYLGKILTYIVRCKQGQVLFVFDGEVKYQTGPVTAVSLVNSENKVVGEVMKKLPEEFTDEYIKQCIQKIADNTVNEKSFFRKLFS